MDRSSGPGSPREYRAYRCGTAPDFDRLPHFNLLRRCSYHVDSIVKFAAQLQRDSYIYTNATDCQPRVQEIVELTTLRN